MNVQQINGTGHNIWVFAVTSIAALFITGLTWYLIETINGIRASAQSAQNFFENDAPKYRLAYRIYMLCWLVIDGHSFWMWNTSAWFRILTNDSSFFSPSNEVKMESPSGRRIRSACDYVAYFINPTNVQDFKFSFRLDPFA